MTCQLQFADDTRQAKEVARYKPLKKQSFDAGQLYCAAQFLLDYLCAAI
jgi:hypothetical protein